MTSTSTHDQPMIRAGERILPTAENSELMRRVDDLPLPGHSLDWGEDGSPLPPSSVVYQYRPLADERHRLWSDIKTQELLAYVQAAPDRFELRTLFTVPVDELWRAPLITILSHLAALDKAKVARDAAVAQLHVALAALGELP